MNELIERYIYDVIRRLPEKSREEVKKELRANIEDMLPENPTLEDAKKVLIQLGTPRLLANGYRSKQRVLISPEWMDDYLRVLKIVLVVLGSIALVFGLIGNLLDLEATTIAGMIGEIFSEVFSETIDSLFKGFAIVTLIFAALSQEASNRKTEPFDPGKLPKLPKPNVKKISAAGSIVGLVLSIIGGSIFIYILFNNAFYVGWYEELDGWVMTDPLFNTAAVTGFVPFFIASLILSSTVYIVKLYHGHWNFPVAIIYTIEHVVSFVLFIAFFTQPDLINPDFLTDVIVYTAATWKPSRRASSRA
jgi:hypothetical protein